MSHFVKSIVLYLFIFVFAGILTYVQYKEESVVTEWPIYKKIEYRHSKTQQGSNIDKSYSLLDPFLTKASWLLSDSLHAAAFSIALLTAFFVLSVLKLTSSLTKDLYSLALIGILLSVSSLLPFSAANFPGIMLAIVFGILFVKFLIKRKFLLSLLFLIHLFLTNYYVFEIGLIMGSVIVLYQAQKSKLKSIGSVDMLVILLIWIILNLLDFTFPGRQLSGPGYMDFPHLTKEFIQVSGFSQLLGFWLFEFFLFSLIILIILFKKYRFFGKLKNNG